MLRWAKLGFQVLEWASLAALPVIVAIQRLELDGSETALKREIILAVQGYSVWLIGFLALGGLVSKAGQLIAERWSTDHAAIKSVLDAAHSAYFEGVPEKDKYLHRVTLFEARRHFRDFPSTWPWRWHKDWKPALAMKSRSGTAYQGSTHRLIIDDENEAGNDGVAGRAWFTNAEFLVTDLPEWPTPDPPDPATDAQCVRYAELGHMRVQSCAKVRIKSRSVAASVVRKNGQRWGVVCFDSRDPRGVDDTPAKQAVMKLTAFLLSQIV